MSIDAYFVGYAGSAPRILCDDHAKAEQIVYFRAEPSQDQCESCEVLLHA